ncbi:Endoglucanase EG-II [Penicillium cataractarum]|uniref:Endoglucanase EG-II n=1 Tax=Penicillium cataractarum TaxID=2100454 RepID=A0A9W9UWJ4_9EURO|nr:Endoglucanase EG-II [Penicillium cataractarum]KAJ5359289.1 Endoglucanase EG-II [Penicillium cataractarum]
MRSRHNYNLFTLLAIGRSALGQQSAWGQCGGTGWTGQTTCVSGYYCSVQNNYYSQCLPGTASTSSGTSATTLVTTTSAMTSSSSSVPTTKVKFAGVNIAGFDFGMVTSGTQDQTQVFDESVDGVNQMKHFVNDDTFNIFRLPTGWQYIVANNLGGSLDSTNFGKYDNLVQGCLSLGSYCIVDIHNYARWNGGIIGQGGPTDDQFVSLWTQLATHYKSQSKVIFGIMNEPHDLNINTWAATVQKTVTAIRNAGAMSQMILLPGTDYTSAANFIENGSGAALSAVVNPDGSTTNLIFDVHKYLDSDNSGTHAECATNNVDAFNTLAQWLRSGKRQALLSETGGGNVQSCATYMCQQLDALNANADVYLGWTSWSAGAFEATYVLSEVPVNGVDQYLVQQCFVPKWKN